MQEKSVLTGHLSELKQKIENGLEELKSSKELYEFKSVYLEGKKSKISGLMKEMKNIAPEELTLEQATRLLSLPFDLGEGIQVNVGKFGPYIKQGGKSKSLTGTDNIFNITLERAQQILANVAERPQGKSLGVNPANKQDIVLMSGRYGPYLKCGKTNYALPKEFKDKEPTLDDALKIINAKK